MYRKLNALQTLRFIAASMILLSHCPSLLPFDITGLGSAGVSIFIILSGFLTVYNEKAQGAKASYSLQDSIAYCKQKLNKFYMLHIITFLLAALFLTGRVFINGQTVNIRNESIKAIINILLLQSFVPKEPVYYSFNAVSWYLSTSMFFYFIAPFVLCKIRKRKSISSKVIVIFSIYIVQIWYVMLLGSTEFAKGFIYISPLFRSLDFVVGCLVGGIFIEYQNKWKEIKQRIAYRFYPVFAILLLAAALFFVKEIPLMFQYGVYWLFISCILVYVFAMYAFFRGGGLLENRIFVYLGNISFEVFLIHQLIINGLIAINRRVFNISNTGLFLIAVFLTIFAAGLLHKNSGRLKVSRYIKEI